MSLVLCFGSVLSFASAQNAPNGDGKALVTFFSSGRFFMGMPGSKAAFRGKIYDEDHELALLQGNRFTTFDLSAGPHTFSANWWVTTGPAGGPHTYMNLLPEHHYYIRTEFKEVGFGGTEILIHEIMCDDANISASHVKPLEQKHLRPAGRAAFIAETSFPLCSKE